MSLRITALLWLGLQSLQAHAQTCTATISCGHGNQTTCSASSDAVWTPGSTREHPCLTYAGQAYKCRQEAICTHVGNELKKCGAKIRLISDNSVVHDSVTTYICCKGNEAIATTNEADCR